jgi:uncharacterized protein involved in exopolysaccharide biosynthesis
MDLWTYLGALRRWWWLALGVPAIALVLAVLLLPPAPWQTQFSAIIVFPGNPQKSAGATYPASILLDDLAAVLRSDSVAESVHTKLPAEMQAEVSARDIADMVSASRYSREAHVIIRGDSPEQVTAVAKGMQAVLPEAVDAYHLVPEDENATVTMLDRIAEPTKPTRERLLVIAAITAAAVAAILCVIALIETLRLSYRAKYGSR